MRVDELAKINEEIIFWETNMFDICINNRIPDHIPDNMLIKSMLIHFREERDYYAIVRRLSLLRKCVQNVIGTS